MNNKGIALIDYIDRIGGRELAIGTDVPAFLLLSTLDSSLSSEDFKFVIAIEKVHFIIHEMMRKYLQSHLA